MIRIRGSDAEEPVYELWLEQNLDGISLVVGLPGEEVGWHILTVRYDGAVVRHGHVSQRVGIEVDGSGRAAIYDDEEIEKEEEEEQCADSEAPTP